MIGLIKFIRSFFSNDPLLVVRRMPSAEVLRAHLYGLTLGFLLTALNLLLDLNHSPLAQSALLLLWFLLVTRGAGLFFIATAVAFLVLLMRAPAMGTLGYALMNNCHWYLLGYLFGGAFALLYNDLVYFFLHTLAEEDVKIAFVYDKRRQVNIIKSPILGQEHAFNDLILRDKKAKEQKLYHEHVDSPSPCPYTIAFVANPKILKLNESETDPNAKYELDPVACDRDLFLHAVDRALFSLESDAVIGRPEIWNRVRVVTVFNPKLAGRDQSGKDYGLLKEYYGDFENENNYLIATRRDMNANFANILAASQPAGTTPAIAAHEVDVIFGLTASLIHDRSTARYTDWSEPENEAPIDNPDDPERCGKDFQLDRALHHCEKKTSLPEEHTHPYPPSETSFKTRHEFCPLPGKAGQVALNVLSARSKTFIHEFAHALSSVFHGAIADEYMDLAVLEKVKQHSDNSETLRLHTERAPVPNFYINRIERTEAVMSSLAPAPVPRLFANYECMPFLADQAHPSAEEGWSGYFPERYNINMPCTMDRDLGVGYRFDDLLSRFIYDRMLAKVTRGEGNCAQAPQAK